MNDRKTVYLRLEKSGTVAIYKNEEPQFVF